METIQGSVICTPDVKNRVRFQLYTTEYPDDSSDTDDEDDNTKFVDTQLFRIYIASISCMLLLILFMIRESL